MLSRCEARKQEVFSPLSVATFIFEQRNSERAPSNIAATLRDLTTLSLPSLLNEATIKAFGGPQTVTRRHSQPVDSNQSTGFGVNQTVRRRCSRLRQPEFFPTHLLVCVRQKDKFISKY